MSDVIELTSEEIKSILDSMGEELSAFGSKFAFVQLRVCAEHFVVPLCGIAAEKVINSLIAACLLN